MTARKLGAISQPHRIHARPGPQVSTGATALLEFQRLAGNAATGTLLRPLPDDTSSLASVQRCGAVPPDQCSCRSGSHAHDQVVQRLTAAERAINLSSPTYAGNTRLEAAFDNAPSMREGETGDPVRKCQQGLMSDGFSMPRSTTPSGPDGAFGDETRRAVRAFQHKHGLDVDGAIGRQTLGKLDQLAITRQPQVVAPPGTGFTVISKFPGAASQPNKLYFERNGAVPDPVEIAKIRPLASPANRPLTLEGFASEDETHAAVVVSSRILLVDLGLAAMGHTALRTPDPQPTAGQGQIDYRSMRMVEVIPTGGASTTSNCSAGPTYNCGPPPNHYSTGTDRALDMLDIAIAALGSPPTPAAAALLVRIYRSVGARLQVRANLRRIRSHLGVLANPANHKCASNNCDPTCSGATAYLDGGQMVVCPAYMGTADVDKRAEVQIHEGAHATPGIFADDVAYDFERLTNFLSTADALNNADSYSMFVRNLITPGSVPIGPRTADIFTGMGPQEERAAERALAFVANWLIAGDSETASLYSIIQESRAAGRWTNTSYEALMGFVSRRFGMTAPPALPTEAEKHNVAGMQSRYSDLATAAGQRVTFNKIAVGVDAWDPGPGSQISLTAAFLRLSPRRQVDTLLTMIIQAHPAIEVAHQQPYVVFTEDVRRRVGRSAP